MPKARITKHFVESIPFVKAGQVVYTDDELRGFGIIIGTKSKTYYAQRDIKGHTVRVAIGKHGVFTTAEARVEAKELLLRMAKGENPNKTKKEKVLAGVTLDEAIANYINGKKTLSTTTLKNLGYCKNRWFPDWLRLPLTDITKDMIFKRHKKIGEEAGAATANIAMRVLRTVYNFSMLTNETLPPNPVRALSLTKSWFEDVRRQTLIKPTQLKAWYEAVSLLDNSVIRDYLCLLLFTGMRRQEGLALQWENIDFQEKVITVPETKSGKPLVIPMSDYVFDLLKARKKRTGDCEWVFPSRGKSGHLVEPKKAVAQVGEKSSVPFMLHDLRRTFITIAESLDISSYALKQLVNHSQSRDVTAGYIVMSVDRLREPMQKIASHIIQKVTEDETAKKRGWPR